MTFYYFYELYLTRIGEIC